MKILVTTFTYPPNADGVAEASAVLANSLAKRGHQVTVATAHHKDRQINPPKTNPSVVQFKISGLGNWRIGVSGELEAYKSFLRSFDCDVLVLECWDMWNTYLALPLLSGLKAKIVLVSHGYTAHLWNPYPRFPWGLGQWIGGWPLVISMPFVMRQLDQLVVLSHRAACDRFFDHWFAKMIGYKRCSVIPNGAHHDEFLVSRNEFRKSYSLGDDFMMLCVANYCDRKNQLMALRAFRHANIQNSTLVFIGSEFNDYSQNLKKTDEALRAEAPAGRVLFLEKQDRATTCAAHKAADLFVLSAKAETQPIVLLEAMACGVPFLSTKVGCVSELPGGLVVKDDQEMAMQIRELAKNPSKRKQLGSNGREAALAIYDWERVVDRYEQLFLNLMKASD